MPYVYLLTSLKTQKSYIGSTEDINRRLREHNKGFSVFTKRYKPWQVIYFEVVSDLEEARKRERYLKSCAGRRFLKTILKNYDPR